MKTKWYAGLVVLISMVMMGCNSDGGFTSESVDTTVPNESANSSLYGTWQLRATVNHAVCSGNESVDISAAEAIVEEYRIVQTADGCLISDNDADDRELNNNEDLFDDEDTECQIGGDVITLEFSQNQQLGDGCIAYMDAVARLQLEGAQLKGTYSVEVRLGDECSTTESSVIVDSDSIASDSPIGDRSKVMSFMPSLSLNKSTSAGGSTQNCTLTADVVGFKMN